jgi:hypothetical protein
MYTLPPSLGEKAVTWNVRTRIPLLECPVFFSLIKFRLRNGYPRKMHKHPRYPRFVFRQKYWTEIGTILWNRTSNPPKNWAVRSTLIVGRHLVPMGLKPVANSPEDQKVWLPSTNGTCRKRITVAPVPGTCPAYASITFMVRWTHVLSA